jgi:hypothetical protein
MSFTFLKWSFFGIFLAFCLVLGYVWNLVIIFSATQLKIPVSGTLEKLTYIPWGISFFCLGIALYFVFQMLVVSVTGSDIVLFFDGERSARRVAIALGYPVRKRDDNMKLLRRIEEMAKENG